MIIANNLHVNPKCVVKKLKSAIECDIQSSAYSQRNLVETEMLSRASLREETRFNRRNLFLLLFSC